MDDQEHNCRINDMIILRFKIKSLSYAHAVTADNGNNQQETSFLEKQVEEFLKSKGISQDTNNVEICQLLPKAAILLKFANRKQKAALLEQEI